MTKTFPDAFEYVNQRYIFNEENYPVMAKLTEQQQTIFALKHGLLHLLKSVKKVDSHIPYQKKDINRMQYLALPESELYSIARGSKKAYLKIVVNIVSLCNTVGFTKDTLLSFVIPNETSIKIGFNEALDNFIEKLAGVLEKADHTNELSIDEVQELVKILYLSTIYWFDDVWVPDFLNDIDTVMKS